MHDIKPMHNSATVNDSQLENFSARRCKKNGKRQLFEAKRRCST
jgi:hypothetical protein